MFISMTEYNIKPEKFDEIVDFTRDVMPELREYIGAKQIILIRTGNDTASTIVTYDSKENAEAATPQVQVVFSRLTEFVTAPPTRQLYEAVIYEQF